MQQATNHAHGGPSGQRQLHGARCGGRDKMKIGIAAYGQISCSVIHFRFYEEIRYWTPKLIRVFGYVFTGNRMFCPKVT